MPKFRRKPVVVEAVQFWNDSPFPVGVCDCGRDPQHFGTPHIHTPEGIMDVSEGDWIITGVAGERYSCESEIFSQIYEPID